MIIVCERIGLGQRGSRGSSFKVEQPNFDKKMTKQNNFFSMKYNSTLINNVRVLLNYNISVLNRSIAILKN